MAAVEYFPEGGQTTGRQSSLQALISEGRKALDDLQSPPHSSADPFLNHSAASSMATGTEVSGQPFRVSAGTSEFRTPRTSIPASAASSYPTGADRVTGRPSLAVSSLSASSGIAASQPRGSSGAFPHEANSSLLSDNSQLTLSPGSSAGSPERPAPPPPQLR
eukprot:RCo021015